MAQSAYRTLLKAVRLNVSKDANKSHFKDFISAEFRRNAVLTDSYELQNKLDLVKDYVTLISSVHQHKELLLSYNIGVDREAEHAERLKNTAQRVGLQLPDIEKVDGWA
ncbi:hypothetical protein O6H91_03G076900 [Diphasiastrum complanatum]|uniref:Uncharacterized protein n=1 Tax=Diphasiastrum complanatum TaxID=34168 RepID=A0ACC2E7P7_DIPCM|nr:hypothetical protein O6H91_03G076900 [Diphasiastrum complanatum]